MTAESQWHPIPGMTVVATPVQSHAVDFVVDYSGSAGTKRRWLLDELKRHLRHRMFYRHACPVDPGNGPPGLPWLRAWGQRATPILVGVRGVFFFGNSCPCLDVT